MPGRPQDSSGSSSPNIAKLASLLLGLAGIGSCLCAAVFAVTPLLASLSPNERTLRAGDGLLAASTCLVPAALLFTAAIGVWFLFGRKQ